MITGSRASPGNPLETEFGRSRQNLHFDQIARCFSNLGHMGSFKKPEAWVPLPEILVKLGQRAAQVWSWVSFFLSFFNFLGDANMQLSLRTAALQMRRFWCQSPRSSSGSLRPCDQSLVAEDIQKMAARPRFQSRICYFVILGPVSSSP